MMIEIGGVILTSLEDCSPTLSEFVDVIFFRWLTFADRVTSFIMRVAPHLVAFFTSARIVKFLQWRVKMPEVGPRVFQIRILSRRAPLTDQSGT